MSKNTCASVQALTQIKDVTAETAARIRKVWCEMSREQLLADFPRVADYARQCFNDPGTRTLRRMAVDTVLETFGVEHLGVRRRTGRSVYYCNTGDTYTTTVLFHGGALRVGCWGDLVERRDIRDVRASDTE